MKLDNQTKITSASHYWNESWNSDEGREKWLAPEPAVSAIIPRLKDMQAEHVLDLGCGVGRHSILLAENGFSVTALDESENGLMFLNEKAQEAGLAMKTVAGDMNNMDFADDTFDYIISWNVIYHGTYISTGKIFEECSKILKPGGIFQGTLISDKNARFGEGTNVDHKTWVIDEESDKRHPHCYYGFEEIADHVRMYQVNLLEHLEFEGPGTWHWHFILENNK
jgi:tellurite methyltransferase